MDNDVLRAKLKEMLDYINTQPKRRQAKVEPPPKSVDSVEGMLNNLVVAVKYLVFDNEATRRELKVLKKKSS